MPAIDFAAMGLGVPPAPTNDLAPFAFEYPL